MPDEKGVIELGSKKMTPEEDASYRNRIHAAKHGVNALKGNDPVGGVQRPQMPNFEQLRQDRAAARDPGIESTGGGVQPRPPGSPLLRPETAAQLQQAAITAAEQNSDQAKEADQGTDEGIKKGEDDLLELFDLGAKSEAERVLNNKKRRQEIEARCAPMSFEDLLIRDEVQQTVPILPGKFEPRYRSYTPQESLFIKKYLQSKVQGAPDNYALELYGMCQLALSLVSINGNQLPDHRDSNGDPDEKLFERKLKSVLKKDGYLIADLGINYIWFDVRVRKLINPDDLKNG
jgi:hypothetical protein